MRDERLKKLAKAFVVITTLVVFYTAGVPKIYTCRHHFTTEEVIIRSADYIRINKDLVLDGPTGVREFKSGAVTIAAIDEDGNASLDGVVPPLEEYYEDNGIDPYIVDKGDFEVITDEYIAEAEARNEEVRAQGDKQYRNYLLQSKLWFIFPKFLGYYVIGVPCALICLLLVKIIYKKRKSDLRFVIGNILFDAAVIAVTVIYLMHPITCK